MRVPVLLRYGQFGASSRRCIAQYFAARPVRPHADQVQGVRDVSMVASPAPAPRVLNIGQAAARARNA